MSAAKFSSAHSKCLRVKMLGINPTALRALNCEQLHTVEKLSAHKRKNINSKFVLDLSIFLSLDKENTFYVWKS
jgi:hypothetical protein